MENIYPGFYAKNSKTTLLLHLVVSLVLPVSIIYDVKGAIAAFKESPLPASFIVLIMVFSLVYFVYKYFFDTGAKLIIDNKGICVPGNPIIEWRSVWYIRLKISRERTGKTETLVVKLLENDREIEIDINYLDKSGDEIMAALKNYSANYDITFLNDE